MSFPKKALLGSLLLMSASSAFAVDTADLSVIGTIAPAACTPTFAGGGVVDYGLIPTSSLSATVRTVLARRYIGYTIHCDAPVSIGTSWTDGRTGSSELENAGTFGLGLQGTNKIGSYTVVQLSSDATGDGAAVNSVFRGATTGAWIQSPNRAQQRNDGGLIQSYAPTGTIVPGAYTDFSGTFEVESIIAPTDNLDLSTTATLDGLSTMTVHYL